MASADTNNELVMWIRKPFYAHVLDPFIMNSYHGDDEATTHARMYFPQHAHAGFETITMPLQRCPTVMDHGDTLGAHGRYGGGDMQWCTAGAGFEHCEVPQRLIPSQDGPGHLFQIWHNLPAKAKGCEPSFKMLWAEDVPLDTTTCPRVTSRTLVGRGTEWQPPALRSPDLERLHVAIVHAHLEPGAGPLVFDREPGANCVISVFGGDDKTAIAIASDDGRAGPMDVPLDASAALVPTARAGSSVSLTCKPDGAAAEVLILEGAPTGDEVVWHGPFVAASRAELRGMFSRYQAGTLCAPWPWPKNIVTHGTEPRFNDLGDGSERDVREPISPAATEWPADPLLRVGKNRREVRLYS